MIKLYSLSALFFAVLITVAAPNAVAMDKHHGHHTEATHACPMNPSITGQAGDECPKCGMKLEPIASANVDVKSCPHGESCKKCQGKMKHHGMKHGQMMHHGEATHACPMHAKVVGQAGDECPKCGMKLEAVNAEGKTCPHGESCKKCQGKMKHHCMKHGQMMHHGEATHACPMHSKVVGQAGDECPKCGMKLEQHSGHAAH